MTRLLALVISVICLAACSRPPDSASAHEAQVVDGARIAAADREPENWLTHGRTYGEERFSPLTQITDKNIGGLGLAWSFDLGSRIGTEATPLVIDGVMYTTGAWNVLHAIDAATGKELWRYDPQVPRYWMRYMCCGPANRGAAFWNGKVFVGTIEGRLIAVDASTGRLAWEVQTTPTDQPYSITGAPRVVRGKVIIGNGGAEYGVRGYVSAYDAETGKLVWRFYTVPGDPRAGPDGAASDEVLSRIGVKTWSGEWWKIGAGGTAWDAFAYDPELNLLYIGTGNGSPWPRELRSPGGGDNLFLCSIIAVNADAGSYAWHYQAVPGENWDYTCVQQMILTQLEIGGVTKKVLMQAPKNGFFYVLDRATGKLLSAHNFVPVNWASHIDPVTGRPVEIEANLYDEREPKIIWPAHYGAHNWHPMSYSPLTGLVYIPAQETSWAYSKTTVFQPRKMAWNLGNDPQARAPPAGAHPPRKGYLLAWNPRTQSEAWRIEHDGVWNGGVLTTAGNLLVQGNAQGQFVIYRANDGGKLWEMPILTGAVAGPISYSVNGEQYIAVAAGWAGSVPIVGGGMAPTHNAPSRILAFKLGGTAQLPQPALQPLPELPALAAPSDTVVRGKALYAAHCRLCHGINVVSGGMTPDLRHMAAGTHEKFKDIVLWGARAQAGMAPFADVLNEQDADAIHAYIVDRAIAERGSEGGQP
jgi:PQQ-dependent dehydrogenase (methanol/ethanol family)